MSAFYCELSSSDSAVEWRIAYVNSSFIASLRFGGCSIASAHINYDIASGEKYFTVYLAGAYIQFPFSEYKKFKEFMHQVNAYKAAA